MYPKFIAILVTLLVASCGGSSDSGGSASPAPEPLLVNAGKDIVADENVVISLLGGSSGGDGAISYSWSSQPSLEITHDDTSITNASLITPSVVTMTDYVISLTASDAKGVSVSDSIILSVQAINALPEARISLNRIEGYANNQFPSNTSIKLDGSDSVDIDAPNQSAPISAYLWHQVAGPNLLAGIDTSQSSIELIAPVLDETQSAVLRLTVTDQEQASSSSDVTINLLAQRETLPSANIVPLRSVFSGELLLLSGMASSLAPDASPYSAQWFSNQAWIFNDSTSFNNYAQAPVVSVNTTSNIQLRITDSFRNTAVAQAQTEILAPVVRVFNDTGITQFANAQSLVDEYQVAYAGQDADFGADRQVLSGSILKVGEGMGGFDFTRLDNNGDVVENPSFQFNCVRDNVSGLIWQVKSNIDSSSLNFVEQRFTWFQEDDNGNVAGQLNEGSLSCNVSDGQCNTQSYISQVNSEGLCGFFDWRLPTLNELQSIVHYGKSNPPMVDTVFFPFWGNNQSSPLWYWTSQSSADGVSDDLARNAWAFNMNTGNDGFVSKDSEQRVILVRAGR